MKTPPTKAACVFGVLLTGMALNAGAVPSEESPPESLSPIIEPFDPGLAGDDPADISRYLMAGGISSPGMSPNGDRIAYISTITGTRQLWTVPSAGGQPRQMTFGNGVTFFRWLPDSQSLVYGADNDGDEQESYTIISADGTKETLLLPATTGGFRSFGDISGDGRYLSYASTERNGDDFDIYVADLETRLTRLVFEGVAGFFPRAFSPDGKVMIVAETVGEDADNLYLLDIAGGNPEILSRPVERAMHTQAGISWLPDGSGFYFATSLGAEFTSPHFMDLATRTIRPVFETDRDVDQISLCGPDARWLVWTENHDGFHHLRIFDRSDPTHHRVENLAEGVYDFSCSLLTTRMAVHINGWKTPGEIISLDLASGDRTNVLESNYAGLDPERLARPQSIHIQSRDGITLQGLLYLPQRMPETGSAPPPVIFDVHGGPTAQSVASFDPVAQYHVDHGFAVFQPNVRGSSGFGRTYMTLDDREKRLDSVSDLVDLLDGLGRLGLVDINRAAVMGGSYGGYMVNAVLAMYPGRFQAGVSLYGVADWVTALTYVSPSLRASDRIEYGDITEPEWLDFYSRNSPIGLADRINVPVLFSHGAMDPRIDIGETETMVRALRRNGVEARYIRIPDEGHGWRKLSNRLFYYRREADFLKEFLADQE